MGLWFAFFMSTQAILTHLGVQEPVVWGERPRFPGCGPALRVHPQGTNQGRAHSHTVSHGPSPTGEPVTFGTACSKGSGQMAAPLRVGCLHGCSLWGSLKPVFSLPVHLQTLPWGSAALVPTCLSEEPPALSPMNL